MNRRSALGVASLGLGAFAYVTTEMLPIGLLPQIATSLNTGLPATGLLVTLYAFTVALSAAPLTALMSPVKRKTLLLGLLGTLIAMNVVASVAPSFAVLLAARFVNAFAQGVFWSIVGSAAVRLAGERSSGTALSVVFGGVSLATVLGVPAATFIGQHAGWRTAFAAVAATGVLVLLVVALLVRDPSTSRRLTRASLETLLRRGAFRSLLLTTILVVLGQFVGYTFIVPYVQFVCGFDATGVAPLLLLFGVTGVAGNFIAGAIANRSASAASLAMNAIIAIALAALILGRESHALAIAAIGLWGFGAGGLAVGLQTRVYALAAETPELGSSFFASAFNIGIGGGALLGSAIVQLWGLTPIVPIGAGLAGLALLVQSLSVRRERAARPIFNHVRSE